MQDNIIQARYDKTRCYMVWDGVTKLNGRGNINVLVMVVIAVNGLHPRC